MSPVVLEIPEMIPVNAMPLLVVCAFALLDVIIGLVKAVSTKTFKSEKMRQGLWHKVAEISVVILAMALEICVQLMQLPGDFVPPIASVIAGYCILMEAASVLESAGEINPDLKGRAFMSWLSSMRGATDDAKS